MQAILVWSYSHLLSWWLLFSLIVLPGNWSAQVVKSASRSILGQRGELCAGLATFTDFHRRVRAAHVSLYPTWMRGINFDLGVAQFVGEMHRERIKGCLRGIISKDLKRINW